MIFLNFTAFCISAKVIFSCQVDKCYLDKKKKNVHTFVFNICKGARRNMIHFADATMFLATQYQTCPLTLYVWSWNPKCVCMCVCTCGQWITGFGVGWQIGSLARWGGDKRGKRRKGTRKEGEALGHTNTNIFPLFNPTFFLLWHTHTCW